MHSLRIKITAITIAAILASLLAFVFVGYRTMGEQVELDSAKSMHLLSENVAGSLDDYLDSVEQSVEMASHIAVDSLDPVVLVECGIDVEPDQRTEEQNKRLDDHLAEHCEHIWEAYQSVASHTNGVVTYYYCISPHVSVTEHGFFWSKVGKAGFEEREPLDARELDPEDIEHTTWYYTPIQRGWPSWVGPYKAHFLNERLTISYLIPIYKAGELIGVLGMDIFYDTLAENISSVEVYDTGFACLLDASGHVIYHPDLEMGNEPEFVSQTSLSELLRRRSSGDDLIRYTKGGESWQLSFSTLSNGMKLVVTAPTSEVMSSWDHLVSTLPLITVGILVVFIPLTLLAVGSAIKPLRQLTAAATRLSAGDYDVELGYEGKDEVGVLTASFRQMRDHLQVYISDLSSRVYKDALTGIKNKGAFDIFAARLNDTICQSKDGDALEFAFVMFDCNGLKQINDEYGHERGDIYLQTAVHLICEVFKHSPVFRVGGDEFVALLEHDDYRRRDELMASFDQAAEEVNAAAAEPWERIDIAKGMAVYHSDSDENAEQVLRRADERMYANKRNAR